MLKLFTALILAMLSSAALAAPTCITKPFSATPTAILTLTPPTTNTDGTPITLPLTYSIFMGTSSGGESSTPLVSGVTGPTVNITTGLTPGATYYFDAAAIDANGTSTDSNEQCVTFSAAPPPVPNPPTLAIS